MGASMSADRARPLTALGGLKQRFAPSHEWTEEEREQILEGLYPTGNDAAAFTWRFVTLIILSTLIASFGLLANSAAVVIGAMLVAPLMTPILGVAVAIVLGAPRKILTSMAFVATGMILAISSAYATSWLASGTVTGDELTSELVARTEPSLLDLGVAVAAGLAAGYVLFHQRASSSLPGAAIAVALVPPLATVGIGLHLGAGEEASGAMLLFVTNLFAIILAAIGTTLASRFNGVQLGLALRRGGMGIFITGVMLVIVAAPLTYHTLEVIEDRDFTRDVTSVVREWDPNGTIVSISADVRTNGSGAIDLVMATGGSPVPAWQLAQAVRARTGRSVEVELQYSERETDSAVAD